MRRGRPAPRRERTGRRRIGAWPSGGGGGGPVGNMLSFMAQLFNSLLPGLEYFTPNYSALAGWIAIYGVAFTIILLLFGLILFEDRDLA